jgi:hypothetical protein
MRSKVVQLTSPVDENTDMTTLSPKTRKREVVSIRAIADDALSDEKIAEGLKRLVQLAKVEADRGEAERRRLVNQRRRVRRERYADLSVVDELSRTYVLREHQTEGPYV